MRVSYEKPPCWDECVKAFDFDQTNTVFSYGDLIYNPAGIEIPDHLMVHEETHMDQQRRDSHVASIWWKRYIVDVAFRMDQEAEAYGRQYRFICTKVKDKNARFRNLHMLAEFMAGPMYGKAISYNDAIGRIRAQALKGGDKPRSRLTPEKVI